MSIIAFIPICLFSASVGRFILWTRLEIIYFLKTKSFRCFIFLSNCPVMTSNLVMSLFCACVLQYLNIKLTDISVTDPEKYPHMVGFINWHLFCQDIWKREVHPRKKIQSFSARRCLDGKLGKVLQPAKHFWSFTEKRCRSILLNNWSRWGLFLKMKISDRK